MEFNCDTKVKDIALSRPAAREILEEARVDYCCRGSKSLEEACLDAGASTEELLKRLNDDSKRIGPNETIWVSAPLRDLTRHIREKHHRYVRESIVRVRPLLERVRARYGKKHEEIEEIEKLFLETGREMIAHMQKEEQILFPYIEALERATYGDGKLEPPFFQTVKNPVHMMMKEHDSAAKLVRQIRVRSADYTPPAEACVSFQALYRELAEFEADLHEHVHLENNILFPRAVEMETG